MNNNFDEIEQKYKNLISLAKDYMNSMTDYEHNMAHVNDVVSYTKELLNGLSDRINVDACIIGAYWHDVGRIKCGKGHEKESAEMLKAEMIKQGYDAELINDCYKAIENHKWNMHPETIEGLIVKDADKLAWIGQGRWKECLEHGQKLDSIVESLPILRDEILNFEETRKMFDREMPKLAQLLYQNIKF